MRTVSRPPSGRHGDTERSSTAATERAAPSRRWPNVCIVDFGTGPSLRYQRRVSRSAQRPLDHTALLAVGRRDAQDIAEGRPHETARCLRSVRVTISYPTRLGPGCGRRRLGRQIRRGAAVVL